MAKQYGLIYPNKKQLSAPKANNVFGNNDSSDEEVDCPTKYTKTNKQVQKNMQNALKEDASIYQYDEVYDDMKRVEQEEKAVKTVERKAKYIDNLLKSAELRKKEQELRKDRMIQKEIEAEDAMFPDKERYVTSSYKAKLEEMQKFEEEQANKDRLEAIGDVTKQKDISGFYRHLYRQTVEKNKADLGITSEPKEPSKKNDKVEFQPDIDRDDPIPSDSESDESSRSSSENKKEIKKSAMKKSKVSRQYRKRAQEESESEPEPELQPEPEAEPKLEKEQVDIEKTKTDKPVPEACIPTKKQKLDETSEKNTQEASESVKNEISKQEKEKLKSASVNVKDNEEEKSKAEVKRKINIWKKRTVGPVFEAALHRYLERKQQRLAGS